MFKGKKIKQQSFKIIVNIRKSLEQEKPRTDFFLEKKTYFFFWVWGFPRTMIH